MRECREENIISLNRFDFQTAERIFLLLFFSNYTTKRRVIDKISMSDAMRIVVELTEETIGEIILRDAMEFKEDVVKEQDDKGDDKAEQIDSNDRMMDRDSSKEMFITK